MRVSQRITAGVGVSVLFAASLTGFASTAYASTAFTRSDANCTSGNQFSGADVTGVQAGDILSITGNFTDCNSMLLVDQDLVASSASVTGTMSSGAFPAATILSGNWLFTATGGATFASVSIVLSGTGSGLVQINTSINSSFTTWSVSSSGGGGGSSSDLTSTSIPAPIFQQFGKPASGTCDAAAPATLNWSGVASGGWGESWAQWMNGGNGGAVCTRTLVYSSNLGSWNVG